MWCIGHFSFFQCFTLNCALVALRLKARSFIRDCDIILNLKWRLYLEIFYVFTLQVESEMESYEPGDQPPCEGASCLRHFYPVHLGSKDVAEMFKVNI